MPIGIGKSPPTQVNGLVLKSPPMITGVDCAATCARIGSICALRSFTVSRFVRCTAYTVTGTSSTSTVATSATRRPLFTCTSISGSSITSAESSGARDRIATPSEPSPCMCPGAYSV